MTRPLVTITMTIDVDGNVYDDTQTHGNTYADVYRGILAIRAEIDRQIQQRRKCPFNPKYGHVPPYLELEDLYI